MLYKGTVELVEAAASLGLPALIVTNGTTGLVSAADRLVKAPLFSLQISIDGHCAELHNALRPGAGGKNSFAQIEASLTAIRQARESQGRRLPMIAVNTVVSRHNFRHLVDLYEAFRDRVDAFFFFLSWWIDEEGARAHERDFCRRFGFFPRSQWGWIGDWKPEDYEVIDQQLHELLRRSQRLSAPSITIHPPILGTDNLRTYYTDHQERFGFERCVAIFQEVPVTSGGDVTPCRDYTDYVVGNIKEATITELWNSPAFVKFRRSLATEGLMPVCSRCCGLMAY
jgi:radical SAM protein with 4Fe4S-binding SPASM domain